ncbi:nitrate/nitrite-specific signal transduction histidine kinase [Bradyrhizobium sp. LM3.2]
MVTLATRGGLDLSVCDNGVGLSKDTDPGGLGARIVQLMAQQLEGEIVLRAAQSGTARSREGASSLVPALPRSVFGRAQSFEQ